jgi:predicted nicotinamide N-methyase
MSVKILTEKVRRILPDARIVLTSLPQIPCIRLYLLSEDYPQGRLSARETEKIMAEPPYWSFCWASGQVLAGWIMQHKEVVAGKTVVDFGAGSGVISIAAALAGARKVVGVDVDPLAREAILVNAHINGTDIQVSDDFEKTVSEGIEVLFAADVLYDKENFSFLERFARVACQVYVADSRVRDALPPPYRKIDEGTAISWPDLDEPAEFRQVSIYHAFGFSCHRRRYVLR